MTARPTRLILVEGSIGTGKTTVTAVLADALRGALAASAVGVRTVVEGDPEHPADLEQVAVLEATELAALRARYPQHANALRVVSSPSPTHPDRMLVGYGVLDRDHGPVPPELRETLAPHDAYELPLSDHVRLRTALWSDFVNRASMNEEVWVIDCCAVQNPLTIALVRDDAPVATAVDFVARLLDAAAPLAPVVVHLRRDDVAQAFLEAVDERPEWWRDHVVGYYTDHALGRRLGAAGVAGTIEVLRRRADAEDVVLDALEARDVRVERIVTARREESGPTAALARIAGDAAAGWLEARPVRTSDSGSQVDDRGDSRRASGSRRDEVPVPNSRRAASWEAGRATDAGRPRCGCGRPSPVA